MEKKFHLYSFFLPFLLLSFLSGYFVLTASAIGMLNPSLSETDDLGTDYINRITFLGESTTYGLQRYGLLPDSKVWTGATFVNGQVKCAGTLSLSPTIDKTRIYYASTCQALTIAEAVERDKPDILIVTLGLNNGASYYSEEEFKMCYKILLNSIAEASGKTTVILQSLFPIAASCKIKAYTPARIAECNNWIKDLALEFGLSYLDTASVLADQNGYLMASYDNGGDGIHLNREGLSAVLAYIRTHAIFREEVSHE